MTIFKYLSIALMFSALGYLYFLPSSEKIILKSKFEPDSLICDTTSLGQYDGFELALLLNRLNLNLKAYNALKISIKDSTITTKKLQYLFKTDSLFTNYTLPWKDSLAWYGLVKRSPTIYDQWRPYLQTHREAFVKLREQALLALQADYESYKIRVYSDIRQAQNQAVLVSKGKSASALSMHQFGLASDIAISKGAVLLKSYKSYQKLGDRAEFVGLTWGGRFKGFIDPNHIQYYENAAQMLSRNPVLRFEYAPFESFYQNRVSKFKAAGKGHLIEDSEELLQMLNLLNEDKICSCELLAENVKKVNSKTSLTDSTLFIHFDTFQKIMTIESTQLGSKKYSLGQWK